MGIETQHICRTRAGFTLMELLVVIAIVAVMVAVTAPNLAPLSRTLEMNRLDNYAKEMYIALQDQFITMESSGEYAPFNRTLTAAAQERNLGNMGFMPQDATDSSWVNFFYAQNGGAAGTAEEVAADDALAKVMARTAVISGLTSEGSFIVEMSPRADGTDVYSVFYSEDPAFSYADVQNLVSRERSDRVNTGNGYPVGYYCGLTAAAPEKPDYFSPRVAFINGEELFLKVQCAGGVGLVGNEGNMEVRVTLSDGSSSQTISYYGGQDFHLSPDGSLDVDILLDSMRSGLHLADIFPGFEPGADLTAQVEVLYTGDGETISTPASEQGQAKANSLYAKNDDGAIQVANVRHMNNLRLLPESTISVSQTANINFDGTNWGKGETTELSRATKDYNEENYGTPYVNPLDPRVVDGASGFEPLQTAGAAWFFDGRNNQLLNFYIEGSGATGLFASVQSGQVVRNTLLVDPMVVGSGATGALVGELYGQLENCGVRLNIHDVASMDKVSVNVVQSSALQSVGGLVGGAYEESNIVGSYAAINVLAADANNVGGLVGSFAGNSISESYASGEVDGAGAVGGLVGTLSTGTVSNCYSTSDIHSAGIAGGFVGQSSGGAVNNCFAYGRVNSVSGAGFVGAEGSTVFSDCAYLADVGYNEKLSDQPAGIESRKYSALASMRLAADHSFPYKENLLGMAFPFANVLDEHWGNWPAPMSLNPILVYYEYYGYEEGYGFYGTGETEAGVVTIDTLDQPNGGMVVLEDGYALISSFSIRGFEYALNGGAKQRLTLADSPQAGSFVDLGIRSVDYYDGNTMQSLNDIYVYQLPFELQMPDRTASSFVDTLELSFADAGGTSTQTLTYYFNPDFAMLASSPSFGKTSAEVPDTSTLYLRTARQLNRLGYQQAYWASNANIVQRYDIDFGSYAGDYLGHTLDFMGTGAYHNQPIGTIDYPFWGSFDGTNHVIIDYMLWADGAEVAGLFGSVSGGGHIQNTHLASSALYSAKVVRSGSVPGGSLAVGGLVGWLDDASISGCSVSGYSIHLDGNSAISDAAAGGLVGINAGTVVRSSAADVSVNLVSNAPSGATLGIGGLVGGLQGSVSNSYAVEAYLSGQALGSANGRTLAHGGIAGLVYGSAASASNCYGYAFVDNAIAQSDDTVKHFDVVDSALCSVSNSYRLSWDVDSSSRGDEFSTGAQDGDDITACDPDKLANASLGSAFAYNSEPNTYGSAYLYDVRITAGHLTPARASYPYPVVCTDIDNEYSHFGYYWVE